MGHVETQCQVCIFTTWPLPSPHHTPLQPDSGLQPDVHPLPCFWDEQCCPFRYILVQSNPHPGRERRDEGREKEQARETARGREREKNTPDPIHTVMDFRADGCGSSPHRKPHHINNDTFVISSTLYFSFIINLRLSNCYIIRVIQCCYC